MQSKLIKMVLFRKVFLLLWIWGIFSSCDNTWQSEHVYYGKDGVLQYTPDEKGNIIPDFSHVGYRYGDIPIPDVPVVLTLEPVEGDNGSHIQNAIDQVAKMPINENGYRGAILLTKGSYPIEESIYVHTDGIVLKGEGQHEKGTVLVASGSKKRSLLVIGGSGNIAKVENTRVDIKEKYVPVGRKFLVLDSASHLSAGQDIMIFRPGTEQWIKDLRMDSFPSRDDERIVHPWVPSFYDLHFKRVISSVNGDTIFFRNPVVMAMEERYGGGQIYRYVFEGRIENAGVQNIYFVSDFTHEEDEEHGWNAVYFQNIRNAWARNLTARHFGYSCVNLASTASHISVLGCTNLDPVSRIYGGRRYSFKCDGQLNLFKDCKATHGRHDYATGARVAGPNVFTNCTAINTYNDIGPHHRWAMGILYDNIISDGPINVQDRGNMGSGHGWSGVNHVFWNCRAESAVCQNPWVSGQNYNIGFTGEKSPGANPGRPDGVWEGHNKPGLKPVSLYQAQLNDRLTVTK
jgi:hypothetical protein